MNTSSSLLKPRQRGAATLVVVMVLFLVMALLAAYANRSLLFEQRVAGSYYRSSLSQEVAEAGVEWTLAQLNGNAMNNACKPVDSAGQRFADKYLEVNPADRTITSKVTDIIGVIDCARDLGNQGWACRCPAADAAHTARAAATVDELTPSFGVQLEAGKRGGTLALKVRGCTDSVPDNCGGVGGVSVANISKAQLARTSLTVLVGLVSAVRSPPASPLVVKGGIVSTGVGGLGLHNADARSAGMLATIGGAWTGIIDTRLETVPGASGSQAVVQADPTLLNADAQEVFKMFMGTSVARYPAHPAVRTITCDGDCGATLAAAYSAGQRIVWVEGGLTLSSNQVLGSVGDPLLVVVNGNVTLTGPFQLNGMLVSTGGLSWTNTSGMPSFVNGVVLVGGSMTTVGRVDIVYQQTVADHVRNRLGSYVRVPGGWNDSTN
ncbi:PilX N-terminal domain-containing pilus assembly protein [Roseateles sp. P5_E7]